MTVATDRLDGAALTRAASPGTVKEARPLFVPGPLRRAAVFAGDLLGTLAIVLCVPFVIVTIGTPIALCVRLLLWAAGLV